MTAAVLILPLARRAALVREVAETYAASGDRSAVSYWRTVTAAQGGTLQALGLTNGEIRRELEGFRAAVQAQLRCGMGSSDAGNAAKRYMVRDGA